MSEEQVEEPTAPAEGEEAVEGAEQEDNNDEGGEDAGEPEE